MINERVKKRLHKDRPSTTITMRIPVDVVESLKALAPTRGFAAYQTLLKSYISEGLRRDEAQTDSNAIQKIEGSLDLLITTVNVPLDWEALIGTLAPNGRMHIVGAVLEPIPVAAFPLIMGQKSISGSPTGSPVEMATMLDFAARHNITPQTEHFPMSRINEAFEHLKAGKARYRIVLDADF